MAWVYILECADRSYYVGSTRDLNARLWQHQRGKGSVYTSSRLPVQLVYCYEFESVVDAWEWRGASTAGRVPKARH